MKRKFVISNLPFLFLSFGPAALGRILPLSKFTLQKKEEKLQDYNTRRINNKLHLHQPSPKRNLAPLVDPHPSRHPHPEKNLSLQKKKNLLSFLTVRYRKWSAPMLKLILMYHHNDHSCHRRSPYIPTSVEAGGGSVGCFSSGLKGKAPRDVLVAYWSKLGLGFHHLQDVILVDIESSEGLII